MILLLMIPVLLAQIRNRQLNQQKSSQRMLRAFLGPSDRIRTCGILLPKQARYQLRYTRIRYF